MNTPQNKYGSPETLKQDIAELRLILATQGSSLLIDVLAEKCGEHANKFKLNNEARARLVDSLVDELREALLERI